MIIVSKLADYAVVLAVHLGQMRQSGGVQASTADLSEATRLPSATVAKVLKALNRAGLVTAARGSGGGYRLARAPREITVAEIIAAIDGPLGMTECAGDTDHEACTHTSYCATKPHWARVTLAVQAALGAVTLDDMMAPPFMAPAPRPSVAAPLSLGADAS
ncbi:MAG: SUF system Fe-S cluster assembly regulator [Elstera sp.]|jgi:FeS assembly SUF system regulator